MKRKVHEVKPCRLVGASPVGIDEHVLNSRTTESMVDFGDLAFLFRTRLSGIRSSRQALGGMTQGNNIGKVPNEQERSRVF